MAKFGKFSDEHKEKITPNLFMKMAKDSFPVVKDLVLESTFDDGGLLQPEDAETFIEMIEEEADFKQFCTVHPVSRQKMRLTGIDFEGTASLPKVEVTDPAVRNVPVLLEKYLQPKSYTVPIELSGEALFVNFDRDTFTTHFMRILSKACIRDWNKLILFGDTAGVLCQDKRYTGYSASKYIIDQYLSSMDGILKLGIAAGKTYDFSGFTNNWLSFWVLMQMVREFDDEKLEAINRMKCFCSPDSYEDYCLSLVKTGKDDPSIQRYINGNENPKYKGIIPIIPITRFANYKMSNVDSVEAGGTIDLDWFPITANSLKVTRNDIGTTFTIPYALTTDYTINEATGLFTQVSDGNIPTGVDLNLTYGAPQFAIMTTSDNIHLGVGTDDMRIRMQETLKTDTIFVRMDYKMALKILQEKLLLIATNLGTRDMSAYTE